MQKSFEPGQRVYMIEEEEPKSGEVIEVGDEFVIVRFDGSLTKTFMSITDAQELNIESYKPGEIYYEEPDPEDHYVDYTYGRFYVNFENNGGYISVNPELFYDIDGIAPTGRYHIYCLHPRHGSCTFMVEQDEHGEWISEVHPPFIDADFIDWVGEQIRAHNND